MQKRFQFKSVQKPGESAQKLPYLLDLTPEGVRGYAEDGKDKAPHTKCEALNFNSVLNRNQRHTPRI